MKLTNWVKLGNERNGVVAVVGAAVVAVGAAASAVVKKQGMDKAARNMREGLAGYERIDLDELQNNAIATARQNAVNSMQLERELTPDIANTRSTLSSQVSNELAMGGKLGEDVTNKVSQAASSKANTAGLYGGGGPITAAMLAISSSIWIKTPFFFGSFTAMCSATSVEGVIGYPPKNRHPAASAPSAQAVFPCQNSAFVNIQSPPFLVHMVLPPPSESPGPGR